MLIFLSFYLRSALARYYLFHTSSNLAVTRDEVHDQELLRLPFLFPKQSQDPKEAWHLVRESANIFDRALGGLDVLSNREEIEQEAQSIVEEMIYSYFDIDDMERSIIADTINVLIPSFHPRINLEIPALLPSTEMQRQNYLRA